MTRIPEGATHVVADIYHLTESQKKSNERYPYRKKVGSSWLAWCDFEWVPVVNADPSKYQALQKPWNGEGLPPVGTVCEAKMPPGLSREVTLGWEWRKVEVVKSGMDGAENECLVFDLETTRPAWVDEFRPTRTPEQIAAEERKEQKQKWCRDTLFECGYLHPSLELSLLAQSMYDKGYRKQSAP